MNKRFDISEKRSAKMWIFSFYPILLSICLIGCSPVITLHPEQEISLGNISWSELGQGALINSTNANGAQIILIDSTYGINIYDTTGNLLHYYNQPGYLQLSLIDRKDSLSSPLLFTHSAKSSSLICYDLDLEALRLTPLINFSPAGLSPSLSCDVKSNHSRDSFDLWFGGKDSTLSKWSMTINDKGKFDFKLATHDSINHPLVNLFVSPEEQHGISSNGQYWTNQNKNASTKSIDSKKWSAICQYNDHGLILVGEKQIGILHKNSFQWYRLSLDYHWELKRIKHIDYHANQWLLTGEFQDKETKKTVYGAVLGTVDTTP